MQRLNAASCLLFALLPGAAVSLAAERVTVKVVQTHTGVKRGASAEEFADCDPVLSRCRGNSGMYSKEFGFHCGGPGISLPAPPESTGEEGFFFDVNVIMPGEKRLVFHCSSILDPACQGFPEYPENTSVVCSDFVHRGTAYKDCTATGSASQGKHIGIYRAALHGDRMTIFGPHWRRSYRQSGTWQFEVRAAQEVKPVLPQEPTPSSAPDSKPATPPDTQPAAAPDSNPPDAKDTKSPGPGTEEVKSPASGPTAISAAAAAEQAIDPQLIAHAKAGDMVAQYTLGYDYFLGHGVPVDYVQAAIWWRKAADQGYPEAQNNLGVLYNSGKGVPQSYAEAYFWQNLAAARANGPLQAQFAKNRDDSGSKLWFLGRLKIQQKAAKWAAEHPVPPRSHEPPTEARHSEYP